jgi:formylglycine-generating enzyme required for sulfatase activity
MAQIFISYGRSDRPFLDNFVPLLRRVYGNDSLWYDDDIHGGADWWQMILDEIASCDLFIYLISNESLESPYCQAELREALRLNKQILPVVVRRLSPPYPGTIEDDLAAVLRRTQYVDLSSGFKDANTTASLYAAVHRLLKQVPQEPSPPVMIESVPQPIVPDKPKSGTNRGAISVGVFALIMLMIVGIFLLRPDVFANRNTVTRTPPATTTVAQVEVETPTLSPEQIALTSVTSNTAWTPVEGDFDGVTMMQVPAGCFMMGSEVSEDEKPIHEQCFDTPFWIDQTEVTQVDFERLDGVKSRSNAFPGDQHPVEQITWVEARDFCVMRGARLPTEKEWEYAARGPNSLMYPWDDDWNENAAVWSENSGGQTAVVGSLPDGASWVGALDMSGNVWEWTDSLFEPYPYDSTDGREQDTGSTELARVRRGGSFDFSAFNLRGADRSETNPYEVFRDTGFRCARAF